MVAVLRISIEGWGPYVELPRYCLWVNPRAPSLWSFPLWEPYKEAFGASGPWRCWAVAFTVYLQNENSARLEHWLIAFLPGIAHDLGLRVPIFGRGKPTQSPKMVQNAVLCQGHLPQTLLSQDRHLQLHTRLPRGSLSTYSRVWVWVL